MCKRIVLVLCLLLFLGLWGCDPSDSLTHAPKPNIIFILVDDLGYGDLGCYGQTRIKTPRLDRMAGEGTRFTQHYAGSTVGAPSREALLSGLHTGRAALRGSEKGFLRPDEPTLGRIMKQAGYETACIGKWGLGPGSKPQDVKQAGFDYFFGYLSPWHAHNAYPEFLWRNNAKVPLNNVVERPPAHYQAGQEELTGVAIERQEHSHDLFTEDALAYIDSKKKERFFLFLNYTIPHANNEATDAFRQWLKRNGKVPQEGSLYDVNTRPGPNPMEAPTVAPYEDSGWPAVEKAKAALISRLDASVGQILNKLKALGIEDDTLVIFTSDNGPHRDGVNPAFFNSNGPLRGIKGDLYEGGLRVPLIVWWPGRVAAGAESNHVSAFWDFLPSFAELVGADRPPTEGISMVPGLMGEEQPQHDTLYWEFDEGSLKQAVRMGKWKAVRLTPANPIELYDLEKDLGEQDNVAEDFPDVIANVEAIFESLK